LRFEGAGKEAPFVAVPCYLLFEKRAERYGALMDRLKEENYVEMLPKTAPSAIRPSQVQENRTQALEFVPQSGVHFCCRGRNLRPMEIVQKKKLAQEG
jgi:hypothetical protein